MSQYAECPTALEIAPGLVRQYRDGKTTLQALAARYDVSVSTVWRELKRQGVTRGSKRGRPSTRDKHPRVIELAERGWTRRQIADHLGLTPEWVRCILAEHGLAVSLRILKCGQCGTPVASGHKAERNVEVLCKFCLVKQAHPNFGERLRAFRLAENLSQAELSGRTGLSQAMIGNYERGEGRPTLGSARKLARGLGVKVSALLGPLFLVPYGRGRLGECV